MKKVTVLTLCLTIAACFATRITSPNVAKAAPVGFTGKLVFTFPGHQGYVNSLAFSPDGKIVATASLDGVKLWDVAGKKLAKSWQPHSDGTYAVKFTPDGSKIATAGCDDYNDNDGCIEGGWKLWDSRDYTELVSVGGVKYGIQELDFNRDGTVLATIGPRADDYTVRIWDVGRGELLREMTPSRRGLNAVAVFTRDGSALLTATWQLITIWDHTTGEAIRELTDHENRVSSLAFSKDGTLMATGTGVNNEMKIWDASDYSVKTTMTGHADDVVSLAFTNDNKQLISGSYDKTIKVWDVATGRQIKSFLAHRYIVRDLALSPDGTLLASGGCERHVLGDCKQGLVKLWK